jgi:hypothetical protein
LKSDFFGSFNGLRYLRWGGRGWRLDATKKTEAARLHRLPAIWQPDTYRNWSRFAASEQMMTYQDTLRFVGLLCLQPCP